MRRGNPFRYVAAVAALALLQAAPVYAQGEVLVPGPPALTREMANGTADFYGWMLGVSLTEGQRDAIRDDLVGSWRKKDQEEIDGTLQILKLRDEVAKLNDTERELVRAQLETELLAQLRQQPDEPTAKWVLGVYEAAHAPIAPGDPPLTRQAADAYAEVLAFVINEVAGGEPVAADQAFRDAFAEALVTGYPSFEPSQQEQLAKMPLYWAVTRVAWPMLPEAERARYRADWAESLRASASAAAEPTEAAESSEAPEPAQTTGASDAKERIEKLRAIRNSAHNFMMGFRFVG